jgi:hypothetical protein
MTGGSIGGRPVTASTTVPANMKAIRRQDTRMKNLELDVRLNLVPDRFPGGLEKH